MSTSVITIRASIFNVVPFAGIKKEDCCSLSAFLLCGLAGVEHTHSLIRSLVNSRPGIVHGVGGVPW